MAVDTKAKRMSALNFGRGILLPSPAGTISQSDRQHLLLVYSGILAAAPTAVPGGLEPDGPLSVLASLAARPAAVLASLATDAPPRVAGTLAALAKTRRRDFLHV